MRNKLVEKYGDEKVYVVPFNTTEFIPNGFTPVNHDPSIWAQFDRIGEYIYRYDAEGNPSLQQIIPFTIIKDKLSDSIFTTTRIDGDQRLLHTVSVACGGHISACDGNHEVLFKAAVRELFEEVDMVVSEPFKIMGYIRDLASKTSDHIGVVIAIRTDRNVIVKETDKLVGQWMTLDEIVNIYDRLDGWSKMIIDYLVQNKSVN